MRIWEIKDIDGNVLHHGAAKTRRGFIEDLVRRGASLAGANLSRWDLSGLDLKNADFRGACFDGADMRGIQARGANFSKSSMRTSKPVRDGEPPIRTRLEGSRFDGACFDESDLSDADFTAARLTHARFRGTRLDGTDFSTASASSVDFSFARGHGTNFSRTRLVNAVFSHSEFFEPDFRGSDLGHRAFGGEDTETVLQLSEHLPDRTRGATVVAGTYDRDTVLAATVSAMRTDARISRATRAALWCTTTLGLVLAGHEIEPAISSFADYVGSAALGAGTSALSFAGISHVVPFVGVVSVVTAAHFIKEASGDWLREKAEGVLSEIVRRVRRGVKEVDKRLGRRVELVVAMARGFSMDPLRIALASRAPEAAKRGFWSRCMSLCSDLGDFVLCDRRHLAMALSTLAQHASHGMPIMHDITVIRCDGTHGSSRPCAMRFRTDGCATAVWPIGEHGHATLLYGRDGTAVSAWDIHGKPVDMDSLGLPHESAERLETALALEAASLGQHGMGDFSYPHNTHVIRDGRDGTILVQRRSDNRLDNAGGTQPALIRVDGSGLLMVNGAVKDVWEGPGMR